MNDKRQALINTALSLFYINGINSIGINEILKTAGIAKKTLYNHFDSKDALVLAALEQRHTSYMAWLNQILSQATSNKILIKQLFNGLDIWFSGKADLLGEFRGCFFINTSAEFSDTDSAISQYCQHHKQEVRKAIDQYLPHPNTELLDAICILKEGAIASAYTAHDYAAPKKCIRILNRLTMQNN